MTLSLDPRRWAALASVAVVVTGAITTAAAQVLVYPRRPSASHVHYDSFEWRYVDIWRGADAAGEPSWRTGPRQHADALPLSLGAVDTPAWMWERARAAAILSRRDPSPSASEPGVSESSTRPSPPAQPAEWSLPGRDQGASTDAHDARGARPGPKSGGVRLYFYERERAVAERAAASIAESYLYLSEAFEIVPERTLPYFLYNTYHEFLQTNLFPIQEGVLGVTSTTSLELALPYFGDPRQFAEISTHEMTHQFTIHKARVAAKAMKADGDPLQRLPLWFIEGMAEFYSLRGLDPRAEIMIRDVVLNPDLDHGYVLRNFFEERYNVVWTYKLGQARCAFLEDVYGPGTLQRILAASPRLVARDRDPRRVKDFPALLEALTGDPPQRIAHRFESWLERKAYWASLRARHQPESFDYLDKVDGRVQALATAEGGDLLVYRAVTSDTGVLTLYLIDRRAPGKRVRVARDGVPGVESLHPVAGRNFDLGGGVLAFVAQSDGRDVVYWQSYTHRARELPVKKAPARDQPLLQPEGTPGGAASAARMAAGDDRAATSPRWQVDLHLGKRQRFALAEHGLVAAESIAVSPDGDRLAFVGLDLSGQRDLYVLAIAHRNAAGQPALTRITRDPYGERELSWGPGGLVYSSDATEHARYNLFRVEEPVGADGAPVTIERLTYAARDHADPLVDDAGRIFFVAHDEVGANVYERRADGVVRRTRVATALYDLGVGPDGDLWALHYQRGGLHPVRVPRSSWLSQPVPNSGPPAVVQRTAPLASMPIAGDASYQPESWRSWRMGPVFAILGASSQGLFGQGIATAHDRLRNHSLALTIIALGTWDLIDANLFYTNQEQRRIWGTGLFHEVGFRYDTTFADEGILFASGERFFGATVASRYPFDRFTYAQAGVALGGVRYLVLDAERAFLADGEQNGTGRDLRPEWDALHRGTELRAEVTSSLGYSTLRYHIATGPVSGHSLLLEARVLAHPLDSRVGTSLRLDAEQYLSLGGATNIGLRVGAGQAVGELGPGFFLSSFDTLRGVRFGDSDLLLGRCFFFSTAELQFPLRWLVTSRVFDLEGIAGADFGGVGGSPGEAWEQRVLDLVTGVNFGIGPLVLRLHFAKPIDVGARVTPLDGDWNVNFSLGYRYQ
ncbi:tolB protein precursor protein [Haliangium sp.]|uniref:tolB protein precursor protein n=1 Tax=Haliangium sp. TaxID=2663208 RepID=UPI003D0FAC52